MSIRKEYSPIKNKERVKDGVPRAKSILVGRENIEDVQISKEKHPTRTMVKSYTLTKEDVDNVKQIKEKCLNGRVVVSDSNVIRLGIKLAIRLSEAELVKEFEQIYTAPVGRPKKG